MKNIFNNQNSFYNKGLLFTLFSLAAAALNYVLYIGIARVLSVNSFGEFSALVAIMTQVAGILLAFNVISIYLVARYGDDQSKIYLEAIQKILVTLFLLVAIVSIVCFPLFGDTFKISSFRDLIIVALMIALTIPGSIWSGFFQGNGELVRVGFYSFFSSALKFFLAILGGMIWGLTGALLGVLLGIGIGLVVFWALPGKKPPALNSLRPSKADLDKVRKFYKIIIFSALTTCILSVMQIFDLLSVRALYDSFTSGQYAGVSTFSRIVYFLGFIIIWVILPEIAKSNREHRKKIILKTYFIYSALGFLMLSSSLVMGKNILGILLGQNYALSSQMIFWAIAFQTALLFITFQSFALLVLGRKGFIWLLVILQLALVIITQFSGLGLEGLIKYYALCTIATSICLGFILNSGKREYEKIN